MDGCRKEWVINTLKRVMEGTTAHDTHMSNCKFVNVQSLAYSECNFAVREKCVD